MNHILYILYIQNVHEAKGKFYNAKENVFINW